MSAAAQGADRLVSVVQGEFRVFEDPLVLLSTVLGSCVAVCLFDPVRGIGGMNHFLLPFGQEEGGDRPVRYGLFAMEMLINALMKGGARRESLQAKVFGGAKIMADLRDIGSANAKFTREFLATEQIACVAESLGGTQARRVVFRPSTGQARMLAVASSTLPPAAAAKPAPKPATTSRIDLF